MMMMMMMVTKKKEKYSCQKWIKWVKNKAKESFSSSWLLFWGLEKLA